MTSRHRFDVKRLALGLESSENRKDSETSSNPLKEDSNQACLEPHIQGSRTAYAQCLVCGRYAKDHARFKRVDNPAAMLEKERRLKSNMSRQ